jgi:predicted phosphoribosyltransferase
MATTHSQELARRGLEHYERNLKRQLELTSPNEFVAIEVESGDYFLGKTMSEAIQAARAAHPEQIPFVVRVGHPAAIELGAGTT